MKMHIKDILAKYENFYKGGSGYTFQIEVDDFNTLVEGIAELEDSYLYRKVKALMNARPSIKQAEKLAHFENVADELQKELIEKDEKIEELEKEIIEHCETKGLAGRQVFALTKRVDELVEEIEKWKKCNQNLVSAYSNREDRLREALKFYADKENYEEWKDVNPEVNYIHNVDFDDGDKARKALDISQLQK